MGKLVFGKLLLGKLVTGEVSVGEISGWGSCCWGSCDWGNDLTPFTCLSLCEILILTENIYRKQTKHERVLQ